LDVVNSARKGLNIGHAYTIREIRKTHEGVHTVTTMGANGHKVFKILTFRPSKKE
jgi:hypothetical protein